MSACTQALLGDEEIVLDEESSPAPSGSGATSNTGATGGGAPVACSSGLTACGADCVDLDSDADNCGACGRGCAGSACEEGLCAPSVIVADLGDPRGLAIDETHLYWTTSGGAVQRAPKSGGDIETLAKSQESPGKIVVDDERVFWVNEATGALMRQRKDGVGKPKKLSSGEGARGLAQDEANVYFSRKIKKGDIRFIGKLRGVDVELAKDQPSPTDLFVSGGHLFWSGFAVPERPEDSNSPDDSRDVPPLSGGYVKRLALSGGEGAVLLAQGEGEIADLTVLGQTAIWVERASDRIRARSPSDSAPVTLVPDQEVQSLANDGESLYWSTTGGNIKTRSPSGDIRLVAVDISMAGALRVDATYVYVLRTGFAGAVIRVAK